MEKNGEYNAITKFSLLCQCDFFHYIFFCFVLQEKPSQISCVVEVEEKSGVNKETVEYASPKNPHSFLTLFSPFNLYIFTCILFWEKRRRGKSSRSRRRIKDREEREREIKFQLTSSTRRNTRRKFFPANFFKSSVDQRGSSMSFANKLGYFETSSSPRGVLWKRWTKDKEKRTFFIRNPNWNTRSRRVVWRY